MIKREKEEKPTTRIPGPKSRRPVIPDSFQISRTISPMRQILNEAEGRTGPELVLPPNELSSGQSNSSKEGSLIDITGPSIFTRPVNNTGLVKSESLTDFTSPVNNTSPVKTTPKALQITGPVKSTSPVEKREAEARKSPAEIAALSYARRPDYSLLDALPDVPGFTRTFHQISDYLERNLTSAEQSVYRQLYRLTWGFDRSTTTIGFPKLAERAGLSESTARTAAKGLESKGLVKKLRMVFGLNQEQGIEWEVYPPPALVKHLSAQDSKSKRPVKSTGPVNSTSPVESVPMIESVCGTKEKTQTHTADAGVGVAQSRFSFSERKRYARDHGLGRAWIQASGDGRADENIEDYYRELAEMEKEFRERAARFSNDRDTATAKSNLAQVQFSGTPIRDFLERIKGRVNTTSFQTWFAPVEEVLEADQAICLRVPNPVFAEWISTNYADAIEEVLEETGRKNYQIKFEFARS
ncbi:MAG: DnaA N-terminal domain-containing protein [Blastocatellia bacterium]